MRNLQETNECFDYNKSRQPCDAQPIQTRLILDCKPKTLFSIAYPQHLDFISFLGCSLLLAGDWPQTMMPSKKPTTSNPQQVRNEPVLE